MFMEVQVQQGKCVPQIATDSKGCVTHSFNRFQFCCHNRRLYKYQHANKQDTTDTTASTRQQRSHNTLVSTITSGSHRDRKQFQKKRFEARGHIFCLLGKTNVNVPTFFFLLHENVWGSIAVPFQTPLSQDLFPKTSNPLFILPLAGPNVVTVSNRKLTHLDGPSKTSRK